MSTRISYAVLLPVGSPARSVAAGRVLIDLEGLFPDGGICFSTPGMKPVISGWWKAQGATEATRDKHLWVEVHREVADPGFHLAKAAEGDLGKITSAFRSHYSGEAQERVIYVLSHELDAYELPGTVQ